MSLVEGAIVTSRYFRLLRLTPALGRLPTELAPQVPSIVLSHSLWRNAFAADTAIIGRQVRVNGQPFVVVAVTPPRPFAIPRRSRCFAGRAFRRLFA